MEQSGRAVAGPLGVSGSRGANHPRYRPDRELARDAGTVAASTELTEIMGIRLMLTNLFRPLATGQKLTPEAFDNMVAEVKKRKRSVAEDAMQDLERA